MFVVDGGGVGIDAAIVGFGEVVRVHPKIVRVRFRAQAAARAVALVDEHLAHGVHSRITSAVPPSTIHSRLSSKAIPRNPLGSAMRPFSTASMQRRMMSKRCCMHCSKI